MRGFVLALLCVSAIAAAGPRDAMDVRTDLKSVRGTVSTMKQGKLVVTGEEVRTYDATGHLVHHEHRERGKFGVSYDYVWDAGDRLVKSTYRDKTGRKEVREQTFKLDANGRILERTQRDPSKPAGELIRYAYRWEPDGSRTEQAFRHYAKEGPYRSDSEMYDAQGRHTRTCHEHGSCSMIEYDAQGEISRIRQQNKERHQYLMFANTYDQAGRLATQIVGGTQTDYTWNARNDVAERVVRRIPAQGGAIESKTFYTYDYR